MTYRSDRRGETPEKPWPLEAVYPVGTPRANSIMARNSNVPFERPKIRMQSICHSTRKSNIRMLKRIFGKKDMGQLRLLDRRSPDTGSWINWMPRSRASWLTAPMMERPHGIC